MIQINPNALPVKRLAHNKNNIRPRFWLDKLEQNGASNVVNKEESERVETLDATLLRPTPFYNQAILEDMIMVTQLQILMRAANTAPVFADCVLLLKVRFSTVHSRTTLICAIFSPYRSG